MLFECLFCVNCVLQNKKNSSLQQLHRCQYDKRNEIDTEFELIT